LNICSATGELSSKVTTFVQMSRTFVHIQIESPHSSGNDNDRNDDNKNDTTITRTTTPKETTTRTTRQLQQQKQQRQ
jgi:hypothetical protein